jgi:hypothetical protein
LPKAYWEPLLRPLSGKDEAVKKFLDGQPVVQQMIDDIAAFLEDWIPRCQDVERSYLTVAIGCTGGLHRSVYVAEAIAKRLAGNTGRFGCSTTSCGRRRRRVAKSMRGAAPRRSGLTLLEDIAALSRPVDFVLSHFRFTSPSPAE